MRHFLGWSVVSILLVSIAGCSAHYRKALEEYENAEPIPFYSRTLAWMESPAAVVTVPAPVTSPTLLRELEQATTPARDALVSLTAQLLRADASVLARRIEALKTPEHVQKALGTELNWDDLRLAVAQHNPAVKAAREHWQATMNQYNQATFLENLIAEYRSFTRYLGVEAGKPLNRQMLQAFFPYPSTIALKGEMVREQVRLAELDWQRTMRDSILEAGNAFYNYQYLHRAETATLENVILAQGLVDSINERNRAGTATQADLTKVQTELERQRNRLKDIRAKQQASIARINALLERPPDAPLGRPEDKDLPDEEITLETLLNQAMESRQEINAQKAKVGRTEVAIRLGEVMNRPLFSQGYGAFERGMMPEASEGPSRPAYGIRAKTKDRPAYAQAESYLTEMRKRLEAERLKLDQIEAQTRGMARSILEDLDVARRGVVLIRDIVFPQDFSTYQFTLTYYSTQKASFLDLLDAERALITSRLELHGSRRALNQTLLRLATVRGTF